MACIERFGNVRFQNLLMLALVGGPALSHASTTGWRRLGRSATSVAEETLCRDSCRAAVVFDQS